MPPTSLCIAYGATLMAKQPLVKGFEQLDHATLGVDKSQKRADLANVLDKINEKSTPDFYLAHDKKMRSSLSRLHLNWGST